MITPDTENVIIKSILVQQDAAEAFQVWTDRIKEWWPAGHSLSGDPKTQVFIEGKIGGRFYERTSNGDEISWGSVVVWEPPYRLVHTWFLGSGQELPSQVEVQFTPVNEKETRVEIAHRGPEFIGDLWWKINPRFQMGWEVVLVEYQKLS
jgi:hypothetical protein